MFSLKYKGQDTKGNWLFIREFFGSIYYSFFFQKGGKRWLLNANKWRPFTTLAFQQMVEMDEKRGGHFQKVKVVYAMSQKLQGS